MTWHEAIKQDDRRPASDHIEGSARFSPCDVSPSFFRACPPVGILRYKNAGYTPAVHQAQRLAVRIPTGCTLGLAAGDLRGEACSLRPLLAPIHSTRYRFLRASHAAGKLGARPLLLPATLRGERFKRRKGVGWLIPPEVKKAALQVSWNQSAARGFSVTLRRSRNARWRTAVW